MGFRVDYNYITGHRSFITDDLNIMFDFISKWWEDGYKYKRKIRMDSIDRVVYESYYGNKVIFDLSKLNRKGYYSVCKDVRRYVDKARWFENYGVQAYIRVCGVIIIQWGLYYGFAYLNHFYVRK